MLRDVNEFEIRSKEAMNKPVKAAPLGCMKCKMRRLHPGNGSSHSLDAADKHDATFESVREKLCKYICPLTGAVERIPGNHLHCKSKCAFFLS